MPHRPAATADRFVEQIAVLLEEDGLPRVAGALFGLLLISPEARSLDELAALLGVSKASVSVNGRLLEQRGVVERAGRHGDRRDYYRVVDDVLERSLEQRMARMRRFQQAIAGACRGRETAHPVVRARLHEMSHAYDHLLHATARALSGWRLKRRARRRATHSHARQK